MKKEQLFTDLNDEQAEKVVGGVGRIFADGPGGPAGAGEAGWFGGAPGSGHGLLSAGQGFSPFPSKSHGPVEVVHPHA